ncbi:hypothetical protein IMZ48_22565 [Candidatus Bathyarchaeota archaeon]|nr:hypothetical protein [Candidatus Bathyarchaeota archaeon]
MRRLARPRPRPHPYPCPGVAPAGVSSLAYEPVSIAASIILFPLIIEVVQMTIFLRSALPNASA